MTVWHGFGDILVFPHRHVGRLPMTPMRAPMLDAEFGRKICLSAGVSCRQASECGDVCTVPEFFDVHK